MRLLRAEGSKMATQKVWALQYVAGNPKMFSNVTTAGGSPMKRSEALDGAKTIARNSGEWRVWVQHVKTGERIYESVAEKDHQAEQPA
jgi:hypothetical protein